MDIQLKTIEIVPSSNNELICESNFNHSTDYIIQSDDTNSIDSSLISSPSQFLNTAGSDTNSDSIDLQSSLSPSHELSIWALHHNITHIALGDLLKFLKKHTNLTMLPNDPRTLLKTPAKTQITKIDGGDYHNFGLKNEIEFLLEVEPQLVPSHLSLVVGIDGIALTSNPTTHCWPILGYFSNIPYKYRSVFIIGVFLGLTKPKNCNEFLMQFVVELKELINTGIKVNDKYITVNLYALICDAPAKSFILNFKGHNVKNSCLRCMCIGERKDSRTYFSNLDAPLRTHASFITYTDCEFHIGKTIIDEIPQFDIILSTPYDYMHLICIGVVKKLMMYWIVSKNKHPIALPPNLINALENKLNSLVKYIPEEFQRKSNENSRQHPLRDVQRWKATELRQFLLYTSFVVLQNVVSSEIYNNFMSLSVAIRILLTPSNCNEYIDYADQLLRHFVDSFIHIYGIQYVSHNIHATIHLADDTKRFGSLENISAFPFENFMQVLKKDVRSGHKVLQQLVNRYSERYNSNVLNNVQT